MRSGLSALKSSITQKFSKAPPRTKKDAKAAGDENKKKSEEDGSAGPKKEEEKKSVAQRESGRIHANKAIK